MKKHIISTFVSWLPLSAAIVMVFGIMYLAIQQYIRLSANEIPMQYAMDAKSKLEHGILPSQVITGIPPEDMQKSLAPFVAIYDSHGKMLVSTATLHGNYPAIPAGVFTVALQNGENRRTWQPEPGIRNAIVVLPVTVGGQQGYVAGGRSLREIEMREHFLYKQIAAGVLITLFVSFMVTLIAQFINSKTNQPAYRAA